MEQYVETPMTFGDFRNNENMQTVDSSEELEWLMSLALDDALEVHEAARFEALLAQEPAHLERWAAWQAMDSQFHQVPSVLPAADFGAKFEERLAIWERRRRLRTGIIFGLAAAMLWGSALGGTLMLGAVAWTSQGAWLGDVVYNFAYWWAALGQFGQTLLNTGVNTGEALWATPQARMALVGYLLVAVGILVMWFTFLRRSLRVMPLMEA